jgi:hypothetical protein
MPVPICAGSIIAYDAITVTSYQLLSADRWLLAAIDSEQCHDP